MIGKYTNGYLTMNGKDYMFVKRDIQQRYKDICLKEYGVKAKVKVNIEPIEPSAEHKFTHRYSVRCRG